MNDLDILDHTKNRLMQTLADRGPGRLTMSELAERLAEMRRLANLAVTMVPVKKSPPAVNQQDLSAVRDWLLRITTIATELSARLDTTDKNGMVTESLAYSFTAIDVDILSALTNLGVARAKAEDAVRRMRVGRPDLDFGAGFQMALNLARG